LLAIAYSVSLPVAKNTNAAAVFAKATKVLSATRFATSFTVAMKKEAAPLFVTGAATPFVNSQGSIFDLDSAYNVTIFKSPGPTSVPTSTPSGLPTGQPSSAPSRAPQLYVVPPLLTPEQIAIVITTAQVLAGAIVVSLLAYVAFFKCYLLDRRWKGGKTKGKHSGQFVLDLPEERVVEIVVEKQAARILSKKDRAKLREQERERAHRTRHEPARRAAVLAQQPILDVLLRWLRRTRGAPLVHRRAAHAKGRAEVRGGGRKPWRQKGTGSERDSYTSPSL
jgi:hypothetical protein